MNAQIKILYLEYIAGDARLVDEILNQAGIGCEIYAVKTRQEYQNILKDFSPALIIADDANPEFTLTDALAIMKNTGLTVPFMVLTDPHPQNLAVNIVNAMKAGASDYLLKERIDALPKTVLFAVKKTDAANNQLIEQNYRRIVETAQEGIWIINENLETIFVNQKMCEILEYPAEEIMGKHNYDFKPIPDIAITLSRIGNGKSEIIETHESEYITKSGKKIFCIVATNGLFDSEGKYIGRLAMMTDITHRKMSEDALRKSEANVSAIIENTTDLVYSLDTDLKFITYNQVFKNAMQVVYDFHVDQAGSPMDLIRRFDPEMAAKWKSIYAKALSGETLQFVNEYPGPGDSKVYLSYSINPIWESGKVIGLSCFSRDITRQKLDEVALRKSAANLTAITENTDAIIYSLDTELRYVAFNNKLKSTMKQVYDIEIKPGDEILDFLRLTDPAEVLDWEGKYAVALKGEAIQFIKTYQVDGTSVYLSYSINPIWENESVAGLSCSVIDITKQKADEIAIRKSEASLRTMFNNTDMSCVLIDSNHNIVSFNTLAQKLSVAQNQKEMEPGDSIFEFLDPDRHETVAEMLEQTRNGTAMNYLVHKESDGVNRWFDVTWAGIKDDDHQEMGHLFTIRDITAQKKLEIEREKITTDLLQRNKALEQFTYIISHNLRAPVANIIGLSSLMSDMDLKAEEVSTIINSISQSAGKLDEVISDLNQVLQIDKDSNEDVEPISLTELVDDIGLSIRNLIDKERVRIVCDFDGIDEIVSVKTFIHSIFYNLILNSIKYRKPGTEPLITVSTSTENGKFLISYQDNGRGIDLAKHGEDIFGLYKRFDTSVEGKGMGLFMVKMQVESLGGHISIRSAVNSGTTFNIEFPQSQ